MKFKSLRFKIAFWAGICLLVTSLIIITYSSFSVHGTAVQGAQDQVKATARADAAKIKVEMESALNTARTLAQTLAGVKDKQAPLFIGREEVNGILRTVLNKNPQFMGVFTCWEPDAFDAMDAMNAGGDGYDSTGRFAPYWRRGSNGQVTSQSILLDSTRSPNGKPGEWYTVPKNTKREDLVEPFKVSTSGGQVFVSSIVVPIVADNTFYGVVGIDLNLDMLQKIAYQANIFDHTGTQLCISHNGTIVSATNKPQLIGQSATSVHSDWSSYAGRVEKGDEFSERADGELSVFAPLEIGHTQTPWTVNILVPEGEFTAAALSLTWKQVGISMICLLVALGILWFVAGNLSKPINRIITRLSEVAVQVATASGEVAGASQQMAEGASEQAASLEETSSSLEEMSSMTKNNADNAQEADKMTNEMRKAAEQGQGAMGRMDNAINQIKQSSDETAKIIKTIDEIAFQTNLLALNAAVEAARAGEAGAGFAVVADEVRNLAQRSAEAARNTAALIENSQQNAEHGVSVSREVGSILGDIVERVQKVSQLIEVVTNSSQEQAQGIDQLNNAVTQMDQVTQANAANAEESASASDELSAQAAELYDIVNRLGDLVGADVTDTRSQGLLDQPSVSAMPHPVAEPADYPRPVAVNAGRKPKPAVEKRVVKPEEVIPFDSDLEDF